jgi:hypothetical protein
LGYYELLEKAETTSSVVKPEQAKSVLQKTKDESNSRLWFRMCAGRITASKFKAALIHPFVIQIHFVSHTVQLHGDAYMRKGH